MTEKKQTISFEIKNPEKEEELKEAEDRLHRIDQILAGIQEGWIADMWRISPGWCEGHLESKTIVDSSPIDLNYIADTWGGEVIQLTIKDQTGKYVKRVNIPMRSFPPRSWGEDLLHPRDRRKVNGEKDFQEPDRPDPFGSIESILSIVERLRGKEEPRTLERDNSLDLGIIEMLLRFQMQNQRQSGPMGGIEQFMQMAGAFKELKGLLAGDEKPSILDSDDIWGKAQGLLETYAKLKSTSEPKPRVPRIAPPNPEPLAIPRQAMPSPRPNPPINGGMNAGSLADLLASLASKNPDMASDSLILALDKMPDNVRERVLDNIYNLLDGDEETFDETENNMNNIHNATRENGPESNTGK